MAAPGPPTGTGLAGVTTASVGPTAPAVVNANDILVVAACSHQPVSVGTISWPAGYTEGQQVDIKNSAGTVIGRAGWAWKRAAGTEDSAAQTITRTGDTGTDSNFIGHCIAIPGCKTTGNPFETPPTPVNPNATTTVTWPALTTSAAEACLMLLHVSGGLNSNSGLPANYTAHESRGSTQGTDGAVDWDYRQVTSAGTYTPANSTQTTDADHGHAQFHIAFIPDSGTAHTQTPADTLGLTDARTVSQGYGRPQADTLGLTDARTFVQGHARAPADGFALTDARALVSVHRRTIGDTLALTDQASPALGGGTAHTRTPADGFNLTDARALVMGHARSRADGFALTDARALVMGHARSRADGLSLTDALARTLAYQRTIADTLTLTDAVAGPPAQGAGPVPLGEHDRLGADAVGRPSNTSAMAYPTRTRADA